MLLVGMISKSAPPSAMFNLQLPNVQLPNVQLPNATIIVPTSQSGTTSNLFGGTGKSTVNLQENAKHEPALRVEFFIEN